MLYLKNTNRDHHGRQRQHHPRHAHHQGRVFQGVPHRVQGTPLLPEQHAAHARKPRPHGPDRLHLVRPRTPVQRQQAVRQGENPQPALGPTINRRQLRLLPGIDVGVRVREQ